MEEEGGGYTDSDRSEYNRDRRGDRRDRGGKRRDRRPRDRFRRERDRQDSEGHSQSNESSSIKTPIILAKKSSQALASESQKKDSPTILGIQRRASESTTSSTPGTNTPSSSTKQTYEGYTSYQRQSKYENKADTNSPSVTTTHTSHAEHYTLSGLAALRLPSEVLPKESINVIDGSFQWSDKAFESLLDQTDYVVVGCVGMQGAGKSTLMSLIAGQKVQSIEKTRLIFCPQKKSDWEKCIHRTVGVDVYITRERMILLDTQPLMSPSMLEQYLKYDRKVPSEYSTAEICLEVQALRLISFLYTVCHSILVVQDHMMDLNLINLLKSSEMLKPSTISHNSAQDGSNNNSDDLNNEFYPHLVFVYTSCDTRSFEYDVIKSTCQVTWKLFENSRLHVRGGPSMLRAPLLSLHEAPTLMEGLDDVNLYFIPSLLSSKDEEDYENQLTYQGFPSSQTIISLLRQQLSALPRTPFTHHVLSEKNWFHYAARTWEAVKKSNLIAEYHRLLTN